MFHITGRIQGVAPILFSRMIDGSLGGPGGERKTEADYLAEAMHRYHRDERGAYIPRATFKKMLVEGAIKGNVKDPVKKRAGFASIIEATVFPDCNLYLGMQEPSEVLKTWGRRPPGPKGAAVTLYYPQFNDWEAAFSLTLTMGDSNTVEAVKRSLDAGGLLVGMGSWRPEYGRFVVTEWNP